MIVYSKLRGLASTLLLIGLFGCTTKDSGSTVFQDANSLDSSDIPEHIREVENLTALDPSQPPQYEINFTPREVYGEIYLNPVMMAGGHNYNTVSVDRNGRVYIMDRREESIHVYKPDGELLSKIGGEGKGPGEFLDMSTFRMDGDRLMAYDMNLKRIQWFDLDSHDVDVLNIQPEELMNDQEEQVLYGINSIMPLGNGSILVGGLSPTDLRMIFLGESTGRSYRRFFIMDQRGNLITEELFQLAIQESQNTRHSTGLTSATRIPSSDKGIVTASPEGTIYRANTSQFLIHALDVTDSTRRSIYYPYENAPLDREKLLENYSGDIRESMQDVEFGDHWPALHTILADDENRLWVSTITEDPDTHTWWVLKDSGELLGRFDWPRSLEIETIRNGSIYVRDRDWEEGVLTVQRHEIQMEPIN